VLGSGTSLGECLDHCRRFVALSLWLTFYSLGHYCSPDRLHLFSSLPPLTIPRPILVGFLEVSLGPVCPLVLAFFFSPLSFLRIRLRHLKFYCAVASDLLLSPVVLVCRLNPFDIPGPTPP